MLVNNDWKIDSRVRREARALADTGSEVHVVCRHADGAPAESHDGVTFHMLPQHSQAGRARQLARLFRLHHAVTRLASADGLASSPLREACALLWPLLLALLLSPVLLPAVALLLLLRQPFVRALARTVKRAGVGARWIPAVGHAAEKARALLARGVRSALGPLYVEYLHYLNGFGIDGCAAALALRPTIVHAHDLTTLSTGYAVARQAGCPLLYDAHELETHTNYWGLAPATKHWIGVYEQALIRRTAGVVTVCDSIADWLRDHYAIARPTVVLNSPDLHQEAERSPATVRERLGLAAGTPLAIYVGSVTIDRGLVQCVQAAALVPGLHFAFVGPRYSVTEQEILDNARRLGIEDRIHLVDPVPSREVASFVSSADCSVIAIQNVCLSYYFCFPNKLLESVIGGVPVAAARLVELERFIGRFPVGVTMDETDPASIAAAIREVLEHPQRYKPGTEVLQVIRNEYGWPAQVARLRELYASMPAATASTAAA